MAAAKMARRESLKNTLCCRGHVHPPWNMTGVLRIAKCESVCGFCQKETKTAANLRKHVAIHIKNEGLNLSIAEGSSGRGRLEIPTAELERRQSSTSASCLQDTHEDTSMNNTQQLSTQLPLSGPRADSFSAPAVLMSMSHPIPQAQHISSWISSSTTSSSPSPLSTFSRMYPSSLQSYSSYSSENSSPHQHQHQRPHPGSIPLPLPSPDALNLRHQKDPFWALREHNLGTKTAWTAIPAAEGFRILDLCKSLSVSPEVGGRGDSNSRSSVPCYNRKVLFDEEWQAHMRDVHGVFLLWPETWMRRIEVLDLDAFGEDIGVCNDVIMGR